MIVQFLGFVGVPSVRGGVGVGKRGGGNGRGMTPMLPRAGSDAEALLLYYYYYYCYYYYYYYYYYY